MSRSSRSTSPSRCRMSTAPLSSSWPETPGSRSPSETPHRRRTPRTKISTALTIGPKTVTKNETSGAIEQRNAIGIGDGDRLRHHLAENDNQRGHDCSRGPHAALAEGLEQDARSDRRRADGDELPSEQHRADEPSARADEMRDQLRPLVARRFERMHAGARGRRQGGLGAGEERRGGDAENDDENVEGVRHRGILARPHSGVMRFAGLQLEGASSRARKV